MKRAIMLKWMIVVLLGLAVLALSACNNQPSAPSGPADLSAVPKSVSSQVLKTAPEKMDIAVNINFDNKIELLGMDIDPNPLMHGKPYSITFYYKVLGKLDRDYKFFGHLEPSGASTFRHKLDHDLLGGKFPTSKWPVGAIIKDRFRSHLPAGFPGSRAVLWAGFYVKGDDRLAVAAADKKRADANNRAKLATFKLDSPPNVDKNLTVYRAEEPITLDGKLDEKSWSKAVSTGYFTRVDGQSTGDPKTFAKFLWDDENLYIAFVMDDDDIWTSYTKRDDPLYKEETAEIMIDADGSGETYFEFQVNAANAAYDASFEKRRAGRKLEWDSGILHGVSIDGTLNKRDDVDKRWTVEIAIPLKAIVDAPNTPPKNGDSWRLNVYRLEKPRSGGTRGMMWSPTLVGDFHVLDRFGTIVFSSSPVSKRPLPKMTDIKREGKMKRQGR